MKRCKALLDRVIPAYARLPLLVLLAVNFISYYIPKLLESQRTLHVISTSLDDALPRVPGFIFIYVLAYLQWVVAYIIIARDSPERCYRILAGDIIAKLLCMSVFLIYPTTLERPGVEVTDFTTWLLAFIYRADTPTNLFPSPHCLESWVSFRGSLGLKRMPRWYAWAQGFFSLFVFASVLLVKQHVWYDIVGALAAAELGMLLRRVLQADRLLAKLGRLSRSHT